MTQKKKRTPSNEEASLIIKMSDNGVSPEQIQTSLSLPRSVVIHALVHSRYLSEVDGVKDKGKIAQDYAKQKEKSVNLILDKYDISLPAAVKILVDENETSGFIKKEKQPSGHTKKIYDIDILKELYFDYGFSYDHLGAIFGSSAGTMHRYFRDSGIESAPGRGANAFGLNHDFFEDPNRSDVAYWLGFLYADGYISNDKPKVGLDLASKDESHVCKFAESIEYQGEVKKYTVDTTFGRFEKARVVFTSAKMKGDLIELGCGPNKTFSLTGPPAALREEFYRDFIRGFFDGDGYVSSRTAKRKTLGVCGDYKMLCWVKDVSPMTAGGPNPDKSIYSVVYHGTQAEGMARWLYSDAELYLDRKYQNAMIMLGDVNA